MAQARRGGNGLDREHEALEGVSAAGPPRDESGSGPVATPSIEEDDTLDFLEESDEVRDESGEPE